MDIQDQDHGSVSKASLPEPAAAVDASRRRFARAGAGVSGVILTLVSQPGMASTRVCKSPSGGLSGGLHSQATNQTIVCGGLSPGYWKEHLRRWPAGLYPETTQTVAATRFSAPFPGGGPFYQGATLLEVMENNDQAKDPYNLGMHLVAAYLNVSSGKISYLTVASLQAIWYDLVTYGAYSPSAGHSWDAQKVKRYLEATEGDAP